MKSRFDDYLQEGEEILWTGSPVKNTYHYGRLLLRGIFGVIVLLVLLGWLEIIFSTEGIPFVFKLFGILGLLSVVFSMLGDVFHARRRTKLFYAISNKRIYIEYWFLRRKIKSFRITTLPEPILRPTSNGLSTILINYEKPFASWFFNVAPEYTWRDQYRRFEYIADGEQVYRLLLKLRKNKNQLV